MLITFLTYFATTIFYIAMGLDLYIIPAGILYILILIMNTSLASVLIKLDKDNDRFKTISKTSFKSIEKIKIDPKFLIAITVLSIILFMLGFGYINDTITKLSIVIDK